jgi:hypothetical protein
MWCVVYVVCGVCGVLCSTLEKALVVPEDRSYAKCVHMLPKPGVGLIPDPILAEKKKNAKGKGGKKVDACLRVS